MHARACSLFKSVCHRRSCRVLDPAAGAMFLERRRRCGPHAERAPAGERTRMYATCITAELSVALTHVKVSRHGCIQQVYHIRQPRARPGDGDVIAVAPPAPSVDRIKTARDPSGPASPLIGGGGGEGFAERYRPMPRRNVHTRGVRWVTMRHRRYTNRACQLQMLLP